MAGPQEYPRFTWGKRRKVKTDRVIIPAKRRAHRERSLGSTEFDRQPYGDATYYLGKRKDGPVMWRLMDKAIDQQNRRAGTQKMLTEKERRTRIEVALKGPELRRIGIETLEDLLRFKFESLQMAYFRFFVPTFEHAGGGQAGQMRQWQEKQRRQKFLRAGMIGLEAMDVIQRGSQAEIRKDLRTRMNKQGRKIKPEDRRGRGQSNTYVAYKELNEAVKAALRNLREREERGLLGGK